LLVLLLLSWIFRFLRCSARGLALNLFLFSNHLFLFINLLKLREFLIDHSLAFRDFSGKGPLGIGRAIVVTNLARS